MLTILEEDRVCGNCGNCTSVLEKVNILDVGEDRSAVNRICYSLYHGSGPNTPTYSGPSTIPAVPREHSAFCKNFRNGYQGKCQLEPRHQHQPLSVTLQGLTPKPWLGKHIHGKHIHIYPFCVSPKTAHATVFQILLP